MSAITVVHRDETASFNVEVEDRPDYSGQCGHCGKTGIRYLATMYSTLYATLPEENVEAALPDDVDEEVAAEVAADIGSFLDGRRRKALRIGLVCLSKHLDVYKKTNVGWTRVADRVRRIANTLRQITDYENRLREERLHCVVQEGVNLVTRYLAANRACAEAQNTDDKDNAYSTRATVAAAMRSYERRQHVSLMQYVWRAMREPDRDPGSPAGIAQLLRSRLEHELKGRLQNARWKFEYLRDAVFYV